MKMRKGIVLVLCSLLLLLSGCQSGPEATYKKGQALLSKGEYAEAAEMYTQLGAYEDAPKLALYAKAIISAEEGDYKVAINTFASLGEYKDCAQLLVYYAAREDEAIGDNDALERALEAYTSIGLFKDSAERASNVEEKIERAQLKAYGWMTNVSEGIVRISGKNEDVFADVYGNRIGTELWQKASVFSEGMAAVSKGDVYGYINKQGKITIPLQWEEAKRFSEGRAAVMQNDKWGYTDAKGEMIIEAVWDEAGFFSEGLAKVKAKEQYSYIDPEGKVVLTPEWTYATDFKEGYALVGNSIASTDGDVVEIVGFMNTEGKLAIENQWEEVEPFSQGLAAICQEGKYGYIDTAGDVVIAPRWDYAMSFEEGRAVVFSGERNEEVSYFSPVEGVFSVIDKTGKVCFETEWEDISPYGHGRARVLKDGKYGFIDIDGNLVIDTKWSIAWGFHTDEYTVVESARDEGGREKYIIDIDGNILW